MNTVFPVLSLHRSDVHWEDHLHAMTPWELTRGVWFKRDDYFAPLGYGGINGSKMRQLTWLIERYRAGKTGIVTGASVQSPQLSGTAVIGAHFGLRVTEVVFSKPHTVATHTNPHIAMGFGAAIAYATGPYNPIIQRAVRDLAGPHDMIVEYGISLSHQTFPISDVLAFHEIGAVQVYNMPPEVELLIVPAGSCNTLGSIILGLSRSPGNLKKLLTLGIGPSKMSWLWERLRLMNIDLDRLGFQWNHFSLHDSGYAKYTDHFRGEAFEGIEFHPVYEAKMWRWLRDTGTMGRLQAEFPGGVGFWVVGSDPSVKAMEPFFTHAIDN